MKRPKFIKLFVGLNNKKCKKINYPNDFNDLIKSVKEYLNRIEQDKNFKLIENVLNREIEDEKDFQLMTENYKNEESVKINVFIEDEKDNDLKNEIIDINNVNDNSINLKKEEEKRFIIPEQMKDKFRKKLKELVEEFLEEIEKEINEKK